ncbi:MAG TPA: RHS repeat domain-containing protein [Allosphingosinicella sp.]
MNGLNQVAVHNGANLTYDANGNLTSDGTTTYTYDVENRLVSATGARNGTLTYDPLGQLSTSTAQGATPITFLYDGDVLAAEFNQAGNMLLRYHAPWTRRAASGPIASCATSTTPPASWCSCARRWGRVSRRPKPPVATRRTAPNMRSTSRATGRASSVTQIVS